MHKEEMMKDVIKVISGLEAGSAGAKDKAKKRQESTLLSCSKFFFRM